MPDRDNVGVSKYGTFLPFRPGLVGGHCIGVDPYYLTVKPESLGYHPEMILAGRRINVGMGLKKIAALIFVQAVVFCGDGCFPNGAETIKKRA